jgi:hypothetical protein
MAGDGALTAPGDGVEQELAPVADDGRDAMDAAPPPTRSVRDDAAGFGLSFLPVTTNCRL